MPIHVPYMSAHTQLTRAHTRTHISADGNTSGRHDALANELRQRSAEEEEEEEEEEEKDGNKSVGDTKGKTPMREGAVPRMSAHAVTLSAHLRSGDKAELEEGEIAQEEDEVRKNSAYAREYGSIRRSLKFTQWALVLSLHLPRLVLCVPARLFAGLLGYAVLLSRSLSPM